MDSEGSREAGKLLGFILRHFPKTNFRLLSPSHFTSESHFWSQNSLSELKVEKLKVLHVTFNFFTGTLSGCVQCFQTDSEGSREAGKLLGMILRHFPKKIFKLLSPSHLSTGEKIESYMKNFQFFDFQL